MIKQLLLFKKKMNSVNIIFIIKVTYFYKKLIIYNERKMHHLKKNGSTLNQKYMAPKKRI